MNKTTKILVSVVLVLALLTIALASHIAQKKIPSTAYVLKYGEFEIFLDAECQNVFSAWDFGGFDPKAAETKEVTIWFKNTGTLNQRITWNVLDDPLPEYVDNKCYWSTDWTLELEKYDIAIPTVWYYQVNDEPQQYLGLNIEEKKQAVISLGVTEGAYDASDLTFDLVFTSWPVE